jgi:hypothetical protein
MSKHWLLVATVLLLLVTSSGLDRQFNGIPPPTPRPVGPMSQAAAIDIGLSIARSWGEPNGFVTSVSKSSGDEFVAQIKTQGEEVGVAASGDLWMVRMSGHFTTNRGTSGGSPIHCQKMLVVVVVATGDVVSVRCE